MKVVISGASGFVGQMLVPLLADHGVSLVLLGRNRQALKRLYPKHVCGSYDQLRELGGGAQVFIHLAVINSDKYAERSEVFIVNVELTRQLAASAALTGIKRFVNVTSVHALNDKDQSHYAVSKRAAISALNSDRTSSITHLYLPAVFGKTFSGKLRFLNFFPRGIVGLPLSLMKAVKPTVSVDLLSHWIVNEAQTAPPEVILTEGQTGSIVYRVSKRLVDLSVALTLSLGLLWLMALIWLCIRVQRDGPAFFSQRRVGYQGKQFTCYKFRTMKTGTGHMGTHFVSSSSVTRLGGPLRRLKLDELPQLWNVIKGEMSLIGPRPCLPAQEDLIALRRASGVFAIRPGISGLAQVNGIDMSEPDTLVKWDARYLGLQSLSLDVAIAIKTIFGGGRGDRVQE